MNIGVEISLYPLNADYIPPIQNFIDRLQGDARLRVLTNAMSTQVFGDYDVILPLLQRELKQTFTDNAKAVFVMKVLGPMAAEG
jgi:uncharacterized protein YqgV (UPF0045/DUF77 family)